MAISLSLSRKFIALWILWIGAAFAPAHAELLLSSMAEVHDAWGQLLTLEDPTGAVTVDTVLQHLDRFAKPANRPANLGRRKGAVWLKVVLRAQSSAPGGWLLDVDYAPLDHVDVYLLDGARLLSHHAMGDHVPLAGRPMATRAHTLSLDLPQGNARTLLLRVETTGSMIVPLRLLSRDRFDLEESREQFLQGILAGSGLLLLLYSLSQWAMLRDSMFALYALTLLGTTGFFAALSGVGPQHLWPGSEWMVRNAPPFTILLGVCGAFFFVHRALRLPMHSPRTARVVVAAGALAGLTALAQRVGLVGYEAAQAVGMALGPTPLILVLPTAFRLSRQGDRAAAFLLTGWGVYSIGVMALVGTLAGWFPVGFWSLHAFQFASMVEMIMWMFVLANRVQEVREQAVVLQHDRDRLHSLAHSDALTGLLNRRGMEATTQAMLAQATPHSMLALYLMDLDGFKPVNDRHGHEVGDALLVAVGERLRRLVRASDSVCRLGGDEFVIVASHLSREQDAQVLGEKLLAAFDEPFVAQGQVCRVGLTIGYALAPSDAASLEELLRLADLAMYRGKQAGKRRVVHAAG